MIWLRGTFVVELDFSSSHLTLFEDQYKSFSAIARTFFALGSHFYAQGAPFLNFAQGTFYQPQPPQMLPQQINPWL